MSSIMASIRSERRRAKSEPREVAYGRMGSKLGALSGAMFFGDHYKGISRTGQHQVGRDLASVAVGAYGASVLGRKAGALIGRGVDNERRRNRPMSVDGNRLYNAHGDLAGSGRRPQFPKEVREDIIRAVVNEVIDPALLRGKTQAELDKLLRRTKPNRFLPRRVQAKNAGRQLTHSAKKFSSRLTRALSAK